MGSQATADRHPPNKQLAVRFRNINILLFILMSAVMVMVMYMLLHRITTTVSRDYALLYSSRSIGILNTHLNREIALITKTARSQAIVDWFKDEHNPEKRKIAYQEMMSLLDVLHSANLYFGIEATRNEFSIAKNASLAEFAPFAKLAPNAFDDLWYFECLHANNDYVLNVDIDKLLHRKLVWLNYKVTDAEGKVIGVLCTGLQFDAVLDEIFGEYDRNSIRGFVIDEKGIIQMDSTLHGIDNHIIYENAQHINDYFPESKLPDIEKHLANIPDFFPSGISPTIIELTSGSYSYASIAPIQGTRWTAVTFYNASSLFNLAKLVPFFIAMIVVFIFYTLAITLFNRKLILSPFSKLMQSIDSVSKQDNEPIYGRDRQDEFGKLARTVQNMKDRLDAHNLELVSAMDQAERANLAKTNFLANMSHEMRTPMNTIIGMSKIAQESDDIPKVRYCIEKIENASSHLLGVINDILDMSKIEAGKFELHNVTCEFKKIINKTINVISFRMVEKEQNFILDLDPNIPAVLITDDQRLTQVITNLLSNAVKFTREHGQITLAATLKEKTDTQCLIEISVQDTGIGLTQEQQAKLFQNFEQADNSISRQYGGTGLGLAISKNIVTLMGGTIWVTAEQDKGSRFCFTILADYALTDDCKDDAESDCNSLTPVTDNSAQFAGKRILLAEDIAINREILLALLEKTGIFFKSVENGTQAVQAFTDNPDVFDLILMDIQMPEMDGYEATKRIRALQHPRAQQIPIIAMTANVFREDVEKCLEAGMNSHLGKPLEIEEVLSALAKYLFPAA